ncbi:hypothetical protein [Enterococcus sp.]|nr:hypothetical protein [Enterococcus sp.]MDU5336173.1 hypothetical protein [Enterococcus sp.]
MNLKTRQSFPIAAIMCIAISACGMITGITIMNNLKNNQKCCKESK